MGTRKEDLAGEVGEKMGKMDEMRGGKMRVRRTFLESAGET